VRSASPDPCARIAPRSHDTEIFSPLLYYLSYLGSQSE
jgi:hypothetical protein